MRLWHESLIEDLPRQQLLGQHRECCALRGNGWGKKHATVDYVFVHSPYKLYLYHMLIISEMLSRGYSPDLDWLIPEYRGKNCDRYDELIKVEKTYPIYAEHDENYLEECLNNLKGKNVILQ